MHVSNDLACTSGTPAPLDGMGTQSDPIDDAGKGTSMTSAAGGKNVFIGYVGPGGGVRVRYGPTLLASVYLPSISSTNPVVPPPPRSAGPNTSITIGADGLPIIRLYDEIYGTLQVAGCVNITCSQSIFSNTITGAGSLFAGPSTSITSGVDGLPIISYYDTASQDLVVAHLSNTFGPPYIRRR